MARGVIQRLKNATATVAGLMSAAHFTKLEGIEAGATNTPTPVDDLYSESTTAPLSANQGSVLRGMFEGTGVAHQVITQNGMTVNLTKYGRVCTVSITGQLQTGCTAGEAFLTMPQAYRPMVWYPAVDQLVSRYYAFNPGGGVTCNVTLEANAYIRFSGTYVTLT